MTISSRLKERAESCGERSAYVHIGPDGAIRHELTYAELFLRSRRIASHVAALVPRGEPVLLVFPSGLEFIEAFFGCIEAGVIAVPTHLPHEAFLKRSLPRLEAITRNSGARYGIALARHKESLSVPGVKWLVWEDLGREEKAILPSVRAEDPVLLQYTSGTLREPKGVVLSHENILENTGGICAMTGQDESCRLVSWLPHSHDMGLIGGILVPFHAGGTGIQLSTMDFLRNPINWLRAISLHRGTATPAPNFAFELCLKEGDDPTLDLSSLRVAFIGAEPVRPQTLRRFHERFAKNGLRLDALYPCYGLAESTLMVSGALGSREPRFLKKDRELVSCGVPLRGHEIRICDPETQEVLEEGITGEIQVRGPSVARGYWNETAARNFAGPWLRTGDSGFLDEGELYVTGRLDDVILWNGRKIAPEDLEDVACETIPELRSNACAAFLLDSEEDSRLVILAELSPKVSDASGLAKRLRAAVIDRFFLDAHVDFVRPGGLPKTTSGKVQRKSARERYRKGQLPVQALRDEH